jgi:hypothetical protein
MAKAAINPKKPRAKREKKPKIVDTRESLIAEMGALLDHVDAMLPSMKSLSWRWGHGPLAKQREEVDAIVRRMEDLLGDEADLSAEEVFVQGVSRPGGTVPSLARPGAWVEWVGYVPVLVFWGGFLEVTSYLRMCDPDEKWLNAGGYQSLHLYPVRGDVNLRQMIRDELTEATRSKKFDLYVVDAAGRTEASTALAENEWLREIVAAGPVDPIPMPPKLRAVQLLPFA